MRKTTVREKGKKPKATSLVILGLAVCSFAILPNWKTDFSRDSEVQVTKTTTSGIDQTRKSVGVSSFDISAFVESAQVERMESKGQCSRQTWTVRINLAKASL